MCGIIGYTGILNAKEVLIEGLETLEYRGYDSAGLALDIAGEDAQIIKHVGPVANLKKVCEMEPLLSHCGIGHTRWATHGGVSNKNAHPHRAGRVTLIHNGIIENYHALSEKYGFTDSLISETDTEAAARLIDRFYQGDPAKAIYRAVDEIQGSYAFCILFQDIPDTVYCIRNVSPLVAASTGQGAFVASDVTALINYSRQYFVLPEDVLMVMKREGEHSGITLYARSGEKIEPQPLTVNWNVEAARKNGYPYFMLKEIHEQPDALKNTLLPRLADALPDFSNEGIPDDLFVSCSRIAIIACGTAMYAGMVGKALMEPLLKIPVSVNIASEFRYENPLLDEKTLTVVISQSGETIDTLAALRLAKSCGSKTLSIVNVKGATIARESDYVLYTHAGPEIAVASTKAYSVQLATLYLLGCKMALVRGRMDNAHGAEFIRNLLGCTDAIASVLEKEEEIKKAAELLSRASDAYYIGRGLDYAFSLEGALKLKEISYVHAEAYAAGELKHGTIALISDGTPVIAIATQDRIFEKTVSNIREVKARGAYVIMITKENARLAEGICDIHYTVPVKEDCFTGLPTAVILQLIAYYTSVAKGLDVDKPRNLAKSVTVE